MTKKSRSTPTANDIDLILRDLLKVIKVVAMYPAGNPLPQAMRRSFNEKLVDLTNQLGQISLSIDQEAISWKDDVVYRDRSKEEALAAMFYDAGITRIQFTEGLTTDDVDRLLDAVKNYLNKEDGGDDLPALLWEANIAGFAFTTIDDISLQKYDGDFRVQEIGQGGKAMVRLTEEEQQFLYENMFDPDAEPDLDEEEIEEYLIDPERDNRIENVTLADSGKTDASTVFFGDAGEQERDALASAARAMGVDDTSPTDSVKIDTRLLLSGEVRLSEDEQQRIEEMLHDDASFEPWESICELLKEMLHQENDFAAFVETVVICEKKIGAFVAAGALEAATSLIRYIQDLADKLARKKPNWSERLAEVTLTAGSRDRLTVLAETLNENPHIPTGPITEYLNCFDWRMLGTIAGMLSDIIHEPHQEAIIAHLVKSGSHRLELISKGIYEKRWSVVCNSVKVLARIGTDEALYHMRRAVEHQDVRVRREVVASLVGCKNENVLALLRRAAVDRDSGVRAQAIETLISFGGPRSYDVITDVINDDEFVTFEREEQQALLKAYSITGGDQAVAYLEELIRKPNIFGNPVLSFLRHAAFEALTHNDSESAEQLLVRLASSWRPDIRNQASAALRLRREVLYGGTDD